MLILGGTHQKMKKFEFVSIELFALFGPNFLKKLYGKFFNNNVASQTLSKIFLVNDKYELEMLN